MIQRPQWWQILALAVLFSVTNTLPALCDSYDENAVIHVYETVSQAVVFIQENELEHPDHAYGSGIIIDPSGYILTAQHVVEGNTTVIVSLKSGDKLSATVIARGDSELDLAILKVDHTTPLPYVRFGNSDSVKVGQRVLAIGNPYGLEHTLTTGIVSRIDSKNNLIQTDAAINPGNSGGPLLNMKGDMIGINQSIFVPQGQQGNVGIGFAIPSNVAVNVISHINAYLDQHQAPTRSPRPLALPGHMVPVKYQH